MKRTVLVVDDETNMQAVMRMVLEGAGHSVILADNGEEALTHAERTDLDVVLTDLRMPGMGGEEFVVRFRKQRPDVPVIVVTAHGTIGSAVKSIQDGAADYLVKPFEPAQLEMSVHNAIKLRDILRENEQLKAAVSRSRSQRRMVGESAAAKCLVEEIMQVAPYKTSILITGESGVGKELVARTIHELSPRAKSPWVAINCSAIPRDLMESELFGYIKGAFTGATQNRSGRLEQAHGGTLFLDEIGDLDPGLQAKLLRVLQEREFSAVGSDELKTVDVRFIAASNRDLKDLVRQGKFREDLLYRLDVYNIQVPSLRGRREDIPFLAQTFLKELAIEIDKSVRGFTPAALEELERHQWPGNIRELRNTVERALLSCRGELIDVGDLPPALQAVAKAAPAMPESPGDRNLDDWLADVERRAILQTLAECNGVQAQAARKLGVSERSLWHRIKKLAIQINRVVN
ncbi:MAG TPA: sigma-54 dependent transcriptional regulator [Burkholderiales bacterium]|nr:sigma-54 dependent transcriptional regulator [Burkholderiales bacterium]